MASPLADLDELLLKCRDEQAKSYIKEAIACYKAGALRSAIVSTWIAVVFDLVYKIKELSLAGDKEAELQIGKYEKALGSGDITEALKFEKGLLKLANEKLELISAVEYIDLERVQIDRHRCAHPSMNIDGDIFNPSAELVRSHIRSAIEHLLQHQPAQGKYAHDRVMKDINSEYFPRDVKGIALALSKNALSRPRSSLVSGVVTVLLKDLLFEKTDHIARVKKKNILKVLKGSHFDVFGRALTERLSRLIRELDDERLENVILLIYGFDELWDYLDEDVQQRIQLYVQQLPTREVQYVEMLLDIEVLKKSAEYRVRRMTREEISEQLFILNVPESIVERITQLYATSRSFEEANSFAQVVISSAIDMSKAQIETIVEASINNFQIKESNRKDAVIAELKKHYKDDKGFELLL